jgi:hypothetical protein
MSNVQVGRPSGVSTIAGLYFGCWAKCTLQSSPAGEYYQTNVLTPDRRPTWTLDIGHWILDIGYWLRLSVSKLCALSQTLVSYKTQANT